MFSIKKTSIYGLVSILFIVVFPSYAQESNKVCLEIHGDRLVMPDTLVIDLESVEIIGGFKYKVGNQQNQLIFDQVIDSEVCFRVLPIKIDEVFRHKTMDIYDSTVSFYDTRIVKSNYEKEELFTTSDIYKTGSLTRGVSFGNSQNVNVISSFNFQMEGKLTDNLNIRADVTDQNIPFQPEGNTQQVREFDNVTFEIYSKNISLKAGDILLKNQENYFLKYNKNTLGGQVNIQYDINDKVKSQSSLAVTAAKGQFADITITALEGMQGPYQIFGPNGGLLVVVLANSESIYLDGKLLKRGFNHDYVIDYNLGEITFNPSVLITQFSRIRVTYEYSDQNYSRSIIAANQNIEVANTKFSISYYREKDNENKPLAFTLTDTDVARISQAGDENLPVSIDGAQASDFSNELVLYERIDTLDQEGIFHSVYKYATDSIGDLFRVSFTNIGAGNGDYVLLDNDVNGRVYEWVAPVLGQLQGSYAAIRFIPAPNSREMLAIGSEIAIGKYLTWSNDFALSKQDLNLYSELGNDDNQGFALKTGVKLNELPLEFTNDYSLSAGIDYEYDGANFNQIDRYRSMEYDRDWSYVASQDTFETSDNILNLATLLKKDVNNQISVRYSIRQKQFAIDGYQHEEVLKKSFSGVKLSANHFYLNNENYYENTEWRRWSAESYYDNTFIVPGYKVEEDRNQVKNLASDSVVRSAMNYLSHKFYVRNSNEAKIKYLIDYIIREDRAVLDGEMLSYTLSKTSSANVNGQLSKNQFLELTFTYRELDYRERFDELEDEQLILGKMYWRGIFFDKQLKSDLSYATSSSQEILKEYIYIQVPTGEGTHTWRDLNLDGVEDLTEFFEAINFDEKNYIKVFIPTTEKIDAFNTVFNFTVNATMPRGWKSQGRFKKVMSLWSNNTNININKKTSEEGLDARFNPFSLNVSDERLVYVRDALRSTFFFNRSGKGVGLDFTLSSQSSKQLISRGVDSKYSQDYLLNLRCHLNSDWTLTVGLNDQKVKNTSQFSEDRNYDIAIQEFIPGMIWQPENNLRFSLDYSLTHKRNEIDPEVPETSDVNKFRFESRWSNGIKNSMTGRLSYSNIAFEGDENSAAAYELLDALKPGDNYTWQINYNQKLISGLQLSAGYEGRKSSNNDFIHMGRMQIIALF